jgi:acyl-coenzyme A synthetase/AMP-(fatty) acid ligase
MGDVGYLDDRSRFWYCGRKGHRVTMEQRTLFTEPIEGIVNTHPDVVRSALVPLGARPRQRPCVIIEPLRERRRRMMNDPSDLQTECRRMIGEALAGVDIETFLIYPRALPTDIRHNAKIFREQLAPWAEQQIREGGK